MARGPSIPWAQIDYILNSEALLSVLKKWIYSLINQCLNIAQVVIHYNTTNRIGSTTEALLYLSGYELRYIAIASDMSARYN